MRTFLFLITTLLFSLTTKAVEVANVYIAGDALPSGWSNSSPEVMTLQNVDEGIFVWSGAVAPGKFKFLIELGAWTNCLNATTENETVIMGAQHALVYVPNYFENGNDYPFQIDEAGILTITVNTKEMSMVIKKKEDVVIPTNLWVMGSAIQGGIAKLTEDPTLTVGYFRYHGKLQAGDFKIITTETVGADTKYYVPAIEDANAASSSSMKLTDDTTLAGWSVTVPDDSYKIKINAIAETFKGEVFLAREELFIVGGATEFGWDAGLSTRFQKDLSNPNLFVFKGVLKEATDGDDRNMFKLLGQNNWGPISFHPKTAGEALLGSKYVFENLSGDHKWSIDLTKQGNYEIKVDLLEETITAIYLDPLSMKNSALNNHYMITSKDGSITVSSANSRGFEYARLLDTSAKTIALSKQQGADFSIGKSLKKGIYLLELSQDNKISVQKIVVNE